MAVAFVRSKNNFISTPAATSVSVTLASAVASGNIVIGSATWSTTTDDFSSISDDKGNTYTIVRKFVNQNGIGVVTFYLKNVTNGPSTFTLNLTASDAFIAILVHEVSGVDKNNPLDVETGQFQSAAGTGTNAVQSGTVTTTVNGDYVFGMTWGSNASPTFTAGTSPLTYTIRESSAATMNFASEDAIQTTAGVLTNGATFTQSVEGKPTTNVMTFTPARITARLCSLLGVGS